MSAGPVSAARYPRDDAGVAPFVRSLGLEGLIDLHVHVMPDRIQAAVWSFFDALDDPPWPVTYRAPEPDRRRTLAGLGVARHTALAYAHRPGVAAWLNGHTLALADEDEQVIPSFTFYPEDGVDGYVAEALARGGAVAKVHLQVGRFSATDPLLDPVWRRLAQARIPVVLHASAVYGVEGGAEYCGADVVRDLLDRHPDLVLVVAHLGAPDIDDFLDLADDVPSLRFDTAMVLTDPPFGPLTGRFTDEHHARIRALADRLLWGSDFPTIPLPYAGLVRGLAVLELDEAGLRWLLHDHAAELLRRVRDPGSPSPAPRPPTL
ncbi:MAG: amidohydrolase [Actinobacteria bacterium]|nr:amidohydrolase [Actinomycetota bacterium]